jgi:hypothetical protein
MHAVCCQPTAPAALWNESYSQKRSLPVRCLTDNVTLNHATRTMRQHPLRLVGYPTAPAAM